MATDRKTILQRRITGTYDPQRHHNPPPVPVGLPVMPRLPGAPLLPPRRSGVNGSRAKPGLYPDTATGSSQETPARQSRPPDPPPVSQAGSYDMLACPALTPEAAALWPGILDLLRPLNILAECDSLAVGALCEAYANYLHWHRVVGELPCRSYSRITREGHEVFAIRPECTELDKADVRLERWMAKVGLTPRDRQRVSAIATDPKKVGEWDDI